MLGKAKCRDKTGSEKKMAFNSQISFVGNLTGDPILYDGKTPRAAFRVAVNEGRDENEKTTFVSVTAFGDLAKGVAGLSKGTRVIVVGGIDSYNKAVVIDDKDVELNLMTVVASSIGPDLRWADVEVTRRSGGSRSAKSADEADEADEAPKRRSSRSTASSGGRKPAAKKAVDDDDDLF